MKENINDYKVINIIGEGAFAKVFLVEAEENKKYALKLIATNNGNKQAIRKEGILLASMQHENLLWARQFFFYEKDKYFVIITDYCADGSLDSKIGNLHEGSIIKIMAGIANGLRQLHVVRSIIHRDLKPQNILLDGDTPKIADLGIAKEMRTQRAETIVGTSWYMALQMFQGDYDMEVDIWALGIIYLELLTGKRIWNLLKGVEVPSKRASFPSVELLSKIKNEKYRQLITNMLKKNPNERLTIQQVCSYFQFMSPLKSRTSFRLKSINLDYQAVNTIYNKFKDYIWYKLSLNSLKEILQKNIRQIENQISKENKKAQFLLGYMHCYGIGLPLNKQEAQKWYLRAYSHQQMFSCFQLHLLTQSERDKKRYLEQGSRFEQPRCKIKIAEYKMEGLVGFSFDLQEAYDYVLELTDRNYPPAFGALGRLRLKKNTEYYNIEQAIRSLTTGAEMGDIQSSVALAQELYKQKKYKETIQLITTLQKKEELDQKNKLVVFQLKAKSHIKINQNYQAIQYYKKCVEIGQGELQKDYSGHLAQLYESIGNHKEAIRYYKDTIYSMIPKRQKSEYFQNRLKKLCQSVYIILMQQKIYEQAYTIADLSATLGYECGKADMGFMVYMGMGVQADKQKGLAFLLKLSDEGSEQAKSYLQDIIKGLK